MFKKKKKWICDFKTSNRNNDDSYLEGKQENICVDWDVNLRSITSCVW